VAAFDISQLKAASTFDTDPVPFEFKNSQVEYFGSRSNADVFTFGNDSVAGGCCCYVSSVTVRIIRAAFASEIEINNDS
jgi:hypothetical protein